MNFYNSRPHIATCRPVYSPSPPFSHFPPAVNRLVRSTQPKVNSKVTSTYFHLTFPCATAPTRPSSVSLNTHSASEADKQRRTRIALSLSTFASTDEPCGHHHQVQYRPRLPRRALIVAFRALRSAGLALSLGLTALAAYNAMADPPPSSRGAPGHLDASGPRDVVFCHQCDNEWYQDEHGLVCPRCDGEATEIVSSCRDDGRQMPRRMEANVDTLLQVTSDNDPRPVIDDSDRDEVLRGLQSHRPWPDDDVPDPDEGDLDEFIHHDHHDHGQAAGPRTMFFSHTFTTHGPRGPRGRNPPGMDQNGDDIMREFHSMLGQIMGPGLVQGQAGRSGPEALFNRGNPNPSPFGHATQSPIFGGVIAGNPTGPHVVGQRITFTTGGRVQQGGQEAQNPVADHFATYAPPVPSRPSPRGPTLIVISITAPPDQLASLIGSLFGQQEPPNAQRGEGHGIPPGLQGLLAMLGNPANAVHGDGVYTQEALDRIISQLMDQTQTSNAPGPASADAIANLPKKAVDEEMLGPELKAECSVCMDDVHLNDEVVVLPCKHWFHEACATAWLSEHNTCPICRTGIGNDNPSQNPRSASNNNNNIRASPLPESSEHAVPNPPNRPDPYVRRASFTRRVSRNEARLDSIRRLASTPDGSSSRQGATTTRRYQAVGDGSAIRPNRNSSSPPPLSSNNPFRRRDSQAEMSEPQRELRRATGTSGSDESRRSSNSGGSGGSGGAFGWLRRFGGSGSSGSGSGNGARREG